MALLAKHSQNTRQSSFSSCEHQECTQISQPLGSFNRDGGRATGQEWLPEATNSFWMRRRDTFFFFTFASKFSTVIISPVILV